MRTQDKRGMTPEEAVKKIYGKEEGFEGWEAVIVKQLLKVVSGADRCLNLDQVEALEKASESDHIRIKRLFEEVGSENALYVFVLEKGVQILQMARLQCKNCFMNDKCPESDSKAESEDAES